MGHSFSSKNTVKYEEAQRKFNEAIEIRLKNGYQKILENKDFDYSKTQRDRDKRFRDPGYYEDSQIHTYTGGFQEKEVSVQLCLEKSVQQLMLNMVYEYDTSIGTYHIK